MFSFIFRLITLSSFILGVFFCNNSFALPYDTDDKEWNWLQTHKFLAYERCMGCVSHYKNLTNNRVLSFGRNSKIKNIVQENSIFILNNCRQDIDLNYFYEDWLKCLNIQEQFKDNKDQKVLKVLNLIYNDKKLIEDIENAKLYKKGFRYFYINSIDGSDENGELLKSKRNLLQKPIEEKIYEGKKFDYIISYYKISILKKKAIIFDKEIYIDYIQKKWNEDLELKNKLNSELTNKKLNVEKQKVFNLDSDEELDSKNIENKEDNLTGFYAFGDYTNRDNYSGVLSVKKVSENKVYFEIVGYRGKPSYNQGIARGEIELINNKGTFNIKDSENSIKCSISFNFTDNKIIVSETAYGFACGFGNNVSVEGTYNKITNNFEKIEYP